MNLFVRHCLPASLVLADSDCTPAQPDAIARLQSDTANDCAGDIADHLAKAGSFATENYAGCSL